MSNLPSRDHAPQIVRAFDVRGLAADRAGQAMQIVEAFASGELKTAAEWRGTSDWEAAARVLAHRIIGVKGGGGPERGAREGVAVAIGDKEPADDAADL